MYKEYIYLYRKSSKLKNVKACIPKLRKYLNVYDILSHKKYYTCISSVYKGNVTQRKKNKIHTWKVISIG